MSQRTLVIRHSVIALLLFLVLPYSLQAQDPPDNSVQDAVQLLKQTLRNIPDGEKRFNVAWQMTEKALATAADAENLAMVIDAILEVLKESQPPQTEAAATTVELNGLKIDTSLLGISVLFRLNDYSNYEKICESRWQLIEWRNAALDAYANNGTTQEIKNNRYLERLDYLIRSTRDTSTKMMSLPVDLNNEEDDASLGQTLGASPQAREALWFLSVFYTLNEATIELEKAIGANDSTEVQQKLRSLKTEIIILTESKKRLTEKCERLAEIVRRNHLEGISLPPPDSKTNLTVAGLQYLTQNWTLCIKDSSEILPQNGVEISLNNTEPQATLAVLASTSANVDILISVIDVPTETDKSTQGSNGWAQLHVDSPSVGEIKVRIFNLGSVPAEIEVRGYYEPRK